MPPSASAAQGTTNYIDKGLTALGRDYENKKQKLLLELQLEYKDYVTKKKDRKSRVDYEPKGFSLPIEENVSIKERLREERKKEYNLFLQEQAQKRRINRGGLPATSKPEQQGPDAVNMTSPGPAPSFLNTQTSTPPHQQEGLLSKRNASTLNEARDYRSSPNTCSHGRWRRRRWQIEQPKKTYSSEEELNADEEEDLVFRRRGRRGRSTYEQEHKEDLGTPEHRGIRDFRDIRETEGLSIQDQNSSDGIWKADISKTPQNMKTTARSTPAANKKEKELATGLMIGAAEERSVTQMKKEQYRQELLRQIAEQQQNKIWEKNTLVKVGATEAAAPRKETERKQQFGAASQQNESLKQNDSGTVGLDPKYDNPSKRTQPTILGQNSPMSFGAAFSQLPENTLPLSGMGVLPPFNYYSGFPGVQGQAVFPWVPVVPPLPHTVSNTDIRRYEPAFYQEGTRKQDPYSNQHLTRMLGGVQQRETYETPPPGLPPFRDINSSPLDTEGLHGDISRQRSGSTQSYGEALRQQVTEKDESTRREKEEKRRDVAQLEAEMVVYDPWGKGGGGAPIKDKHGNLVSDLYHMRKINNRITSLKAESESPTSLQELGHQSPLQKERYKEELKQQMEEKQRKQAEERERVRIAEENEQKRIAMERTRMQQQYEEEKRREEMKRNRRKPSNQAETCETKKIISKGEKNQTSECQNVHQKERGSSPPIPMLHKNHANVVTSNPSSVVSPLTSRAERIISAPNIQPVPESKSSIPAGQQEVIRELSALRRFLRREQRELELQLGQKETHRSHLNKH